jgi:hypothetical protein
MRGEALASIRNRILFIAALGLHRGLFSTDLTLLTTPSIFTD